MKKIRAVICDVYRTILEVLPAPADAAERWDRLCGETLGETPFSLGALSERCRTIVGTDHDSAKALGVLFPEVVWPEVMRRALPGAGALDAAVLDVFLFGHMQILRELRLMPGSAEVLRGCSQAGLMLGIASNAQRYTLEELSRGLGGEGLSPEIFDPELSLWSWQLGFSKPNPHVFRILTARLAHRGIRPDEILMIGDRPDNDIEPARAFGWQTARIAPDGTGWGAVRARLFGQP